MEIPELKTKIKALKAELREANALLDKALGFVKKSHHIDGCEHRWGRDCNCGKFEIEQHREGSEWGNTTAQVLNAQENNA